MAFFHVFNITCFLLKKKKSNVYTVIHLVLYYLLDHLMFCQKNKPLVCLECNLQQGDGLVLCRACISNFYFCTPTQQCCPSPRFVWAAQVRLLQVGATLHPQRNYLLGFISINIPLEFCISFTQCLFVQKLFGNYSLLFVSLKCDAIVLITVACFLPLFWTRQIILYF